MVPGLEISLIFSVTLVRSSVVVPFSLSWKGVAMTIMDSSVGANISSGLQFLEGGEVFKE